MERRDDIPFAPAIYLPGHTWQYEVPPRDPACQAKLAADLNGDCRVDFADLAILASEWLAPGPPSNAPK
jgi:hypothetical protein